MSTEDILILLQIIYRRRNVKFMMITTSAASKIMMATRKYLYNLKYISTYFSEAGTNSTALSSGANSPQLERHVIPAMSHHVARHVPHTRQHPETVSSPQYQVTTNPPLHGNIFNVKYFCPDRISQYG